MNTLAQVPIRQVALGFSAGALSMALLTLVATALAQTPTPAAPDMQLMLEWYRQMMGQAGSMMQRMMGGMCTMGRSQHLSEPGGTRARSAFASRTRHVSEPQTAFGHTR